MYRQILSIVPIVLLYPPPMPGSRVELVSVALRAKGEVAEVNLSEAYLKSAGAVAQKRAAEAAVSLAGVWGR